MKQILSFAIVTALNVSTAGCSSFRSKPLLEGEILQELKALRIENLRPSMETGPAIGPSRASFDPTNGLSREEAVAVALYLNPDLRVFRRQRGIAEGELVAAGLFPNPELQATWLHIAHFTNSLATSGFDVALNWAPPRPGERTARIAQAQARIEEVRAEIAAEEWKLAAAVRFAHASVRAAKERLTIAEAMLRLQERIRNFERERKVLGDASDLEVNLAEIGHAEMARDREIVSQELERLRRELLLLLGLPPEYELGLEETEAFAYRPVPIDPAALDSTMLRYRPGLQAARMAYQEAQEALRLAYIRRWPWFRFGPAYSRDEIEGQAGNRFGIGVGIDLPLANLNQGEVAIREAERAQLEAAFSAAIHGGRPEVAAALRELQAAERLIRLYDETIRPALEQSLQLIEAGLDLREFNLLQVITTQDKVLRARRENVEALLRYWKAIFDLEQGVGIRLSETPENR